MLRVMNRKDRFLVSNIETNFPEANRSLWYWYSLQGEYSR